ncbi:exodeoxyribonuclease VII large subunit [Streptococcus sp. CSL10205-OR2]|uniref:exodeoxyribonuclease VII large subunit n=1 Tax=Streptococcus sp. CSL10205-OR2 TaxID=2980558 RepID=UPI0021D8F276|nr:exodeoxyribonuclease VII large subunit [Streptococcus sp. CSL10205-OR2]MCU9534278.1 exodeoxyribonuclease VII large subunit [Streptococcus sp. CSL10205-OR2]
MSEYLSVSHLTKYLKLKFDRDPYLERVYLTGEVSNFRKRPSHQYFSLKDDKAVIQATMWAGVFKSLKFEIEEGMKLNVIGRIQLYEPNGSYSILIEKAEPDGVGALAVQFEQLKKKLTTAGYFDQKHKQQFPQFVKKIGVVTSQSGAVIRDIITTVQRRFPGVEILLFPTKVQGPGSAEEIVANIKRANLRDDLDILIIGRGGGSIEDLWSFNEEIVVEAIFESRLPIISSVGHETDTTLADFAADRRAATPTAAAELATPVTKADVYQYLNERQTRLYNIMMQQLKIKKDRLNQLTGSVIFRQPERLYDSYLQKLDKLTNQMANLFKESYRQKEHHTHLLVNRLVAIDLLKRIKTYEDYIVQTNRLLSHQITTHYQQKLTRFEKSQEALLSLDTSRIVARGYAIVHKENQVIGSVEKIVKGDSLDISMRDGQIEVEVKNVKKQ